jgi:hypothetical protein
MGYDLHITKKTNWFDEDVKHDISQEDWKIYIQHDSEMILEGFAEATTQNQESIRFEDKSIAVWTKYSKNNSNGNFAWFYLSSGNITVKNPDKEIIQKMLQIAKNMQARLQGDEGEYYDEQIVSAKINKAWWKFW